MKTNTATLRQIPASIWVLGFVTAIAPEQPNRRAAPASLATAGLASAKTSHTTSTSIKVPWLAAYRHTARQLTAAARFHAPLVKPSVPTLLLASEQDHLASVNCSKILANYWQCDLLIHNTAGHDLPLDDGTWVIAQ